MSPMPQWIKKLRQHDIVRETEWYIEYIVALWIVRKVGLFLLGSGEAAFILKIHYYGTATVLIYFAVSIILRRIRRDFYDQRFSL